MSFPLELEQRLCRDLRRIKDLTFTIKNFIHLPQRNISHTYFVIDALATAKEIINSYPSSFIQHPRIHRKVDKVFTIFLATTAFFTSQTRLKPMSMELGLMLMKCTMAKIN